MKIPYIDPPSAFVTHGCRIKPSRKSRGALAERHASEAMRDYLVTNDMGPTDEMVVFGTRP
jgi:hypothetical protein